MPYFYLIGTQKGGTTALGNLMRHYLPGYVHGITKEYHFWENKRVNHLTKPADKKCGKKIRSHSNPIACNLWK